MRCSVLRNRDLFLYLAPPDVNHKPFLDIPTLCMDTVIIRPCPSYHKSLFDPVSYISGLGTSHFLTLLPTPLYF